MPTLSMVVSILELPAVVIPGEGGLDGLEPGKGADRMVARFGPQVPQEKIGPDKLA